MINIRIIVYMKLVMLALVVLLSLSTSAWTQPAGSYAGADPTENVKALVILEAKLANELRIASDKFNAAAIANARMLFETGLSNLKENVALRAELDEKLRIAEKGRLDAIRLVDQNNVTVASQKADQQAAALAKNVSEVAETLRKTAADNADKLAALVTSKAAEAAASQQQLLAGVNTQIASVLTRVTTLEQSGAGIAGKGEGISTTMAVLGTVAFLILAMLAFGVPLLIKRNNNGGVPRGG